MPRETHSEPHGSDLPERPAEPTVRTWLKMAAFVAATAGPVAAGLAYIPRPSLLAFDSPLFLVWGLVWAASLMWACVRAGPKERRKLLWLWLFLPAAFAPATAYAYLWITFMISANSGGSPP